MTLRPQNDKPVYVRLRETIADAILAGQYGDGDPLPSDGGEKRPASIGKKKSPPTSPSDENGVETIGLAGTGEA